MTHSHHTDEVRLVTGTDTIKTIKSSSNRKKKKAKDYGIIWLEEPYNSARGETALWVAVITQAMMDALSHAKNSEASFHKHEAIQWLTTKNKDFDLVCHYAGLDPDYVRRKAKRSLVAPIPWRAAPGKGKRYHERKAYRQRIKQLTQSVPGADDSPAFSNVIQGPWSLRTQFA